MELNVTLNEGKYVVAVSGGVDSVALLHLLSNLSKTYNLKPASRLIVAHVDHNIREESADDAKFVQSLAEAYGISFESTQLDGGVKDEATLRAKRYEFLKKVADKYNARLVTAHHQDDLLETAIHNILRGTGPHGLVPMLNNNQIVRPMLRISKNEIIDYAKHNNLEWRDDPTNENTDYSRNYIRHNIIPKLPSPARDKLLELIYGTASLVKQADSIIKQELSIARGGRLSHIFSRAMLLRFDYKELSYLMRQELIDLRHSDIDREVIERACIAVKTLRPGKKVQLGNGIEMSSGADLVKFTSKK